MLHDAMAEAAKSNTARVAKRRDECAAHHARLEENWAQKLAAEIVESFTSTRSGEVNNSLHRTFLVGASTSPRDVLRPGSHGFDPRLRGERARDSDRALLL
jgi:hypothetical protein